MIWREEGKKKIWYKSTGQRLFQVDLESLVALNPHVTTRNLVPNGPMENVTNNVVTSNMNAVNNQNTNTANSRQTIAADIRPPPVSTSSFTTHTFSFAISTNSVQFSSTIIR